ncbi:MAG: HAD hydrolase-like protein [Lachnospiraceae bacterium]|nr:HAD hydrolase-like protein [Lachnospiraceae bacterium]
MKRYRNIFFDLDGTLFNTRPGIAHCIEFTSRKLGISMPDDATIDSMIGPPLGDSMAEKLGIPKDDVPHALDVWRGEYNHVGWSMCEPYPGIPEAVKSLHETGYRIYTATSKVEHAARMILSEKGLAPYFDDICGASEDGSIDKKADVIALVARRNTSVRLSESVLIGDTFFDCEGAQKAGIDMVGAGWGFGDEAELLENGAIKVFREPSELIPYFADRLIE